YLSQYGECHPADAIAALEAELSRALKEKPGKPTNAVRHVADRLLRVVRDKPDGASYLVVTDGGEDGEGEASGEWHSLHRVGLSTLRAGCASWKIPRCATGPECLFSSHTDYSR